jgi:hypothetical protein
LLIIPFNADLELKSKNNRTFNADLSFLELCKTLQNHNEELQQKNLSLLTEHSIETLKHQQEVDKLNEIIKGHRTSHFELSKMNDELHEQFVQVQGMFENFKRQLQYILNSKESDHNKIIAIISLLGHGTHTFMLIFEKRAFLFERERERERREIEIEIEIKIKEKEKMLSYLIVLVLDSSPIRPQPQKKPLVTFVLETEHSFPSQQLSTYSQYKSKEELTSPRQSTSLFITTQIQQSSVANAKHKKSHKESSGKNNNSKLTRSK